MDFYLGIDIGTSRVKAVLFDQHFTACASAAENTSPRLSANGYAEQDMTQLWFGAGYSAPDCPPSGATGGRLRAIGLAGQGGVWLSDDQGEPVGPGILWRYPQPRADERPAAPTRLTAAISPIPAPTCSPAIPACSCTG
ncbi:FGGY family carbohydrate kinase [Klebsiella pneumoniae]|uniref:FGGY family carbohydrate kinase n=1 Tax=Klebsiella pneumoniae TaxID=573 RepID=UPI000F1374E3|nr:FGGY family carbohydrate kinase [Klebsiella pneumoniae]VCY61236.1 Xylulose kinase [Klebsiella pneumoniae]